MGVHDCGCTMGTDTSIRAVVDALNTKTMMRNSNAM